ncbi:hypothetical protein M9Y10_029874 [Tritrichomonas musculus]|uniref:Surface antigen BspA-like n=1 Tax=Tritrichomonas musculus TaxID=1915356 RepID=A0ABR2KNC4_9EUKA
MLKRQKRNVPEIQPPEPKFIERVHNKHTSVSETDLKNTKKINKNLFKKMHSDYIYEINFTKDSQLRQICQDSFVSLNLYSITFPPSLSTIMPESFKGCHYLNDINFINADSNENKLEIYDNAFHDTIIQSITIPKNTKKIYSSCFPKSLKNIEFENGGPKLEKVGNNLFCQTQIESFKFPTNFEIFIYPKNIFLHCKKLKTLIFDSYLNKSEKYQIGKDDEIYEKEKRMRKKLKFNQNLIDTIGNNDDIFRSQDFAISYLISQTKIEKLEVYVSNLNYFYFFNTPKLTSITVSDGEDSRYVKIDGCLYTKDKKKLIVAERNLKNIKIDSSCQIISNYAFNIDSVEKVTFEKNSELKEISFFAFSESQLKSIVIPDSVDLIDYGAFYKCEKLETVNIPRSMNFIDFFTFSYTNLAKILIPNNVIKIAFGCFFHCCNLTSVSFEKDSNLIEIDDYAFSSTKINSISIPKSVKRIGNCCFLNCNNLETVTFGDDTNICQIGFQCFNGTKIIESKLNEIYQKVSYSQIYFIESFNKENITSVTMPTGITTIERNAFKGCINLKKVEIQKDSNITKIMDGAFSNCSSLTEFVVPKNIDYFGKECFQNCLKYEGHIAISNQRKTFVGLSAFEGSGLISFQSEGRSIIVGDCAFKNCKKLVEFQANVYFESILGTSAFENCSKLKKAFISPSVEKVSFGKCCFMNTAIQEFIIPENLKVIQQSTFKNCKHLNEVKFDEINSKIKFIKAEAFQSSGIQKILIPPQTLVIEEKSFSDCSNLSYFCFIRNSLFHKLCFSCFENCTNLKEITIPESLKIKIIDMNTFSGCSIESITLPHSIYQIHKHSFLNCTKLNSVTFLDEVKIDSFAFSGCSNLQTIKTNSLIKLEISFADDPFRLNEMFVIFKSNVTNKDTINSLFSNEKPTFKARQIINYKSSFILNDDYNINEPLVLNIFKTRDYIIAQHIKGGYYKNSKEAIYYVDNSIDSLSILKNTKLIEKSAFEFSNLKKIDFQVDCQLEKIKKFAFRNLQIEEISIPDSVTSIGNNAFYNCKLLKKVNITPQSHLKIIKSSAFEKCGIESFVFPSTLETIKDFAFFECFNLAKIDNYSEKIEFGYKSLARSGIENIEFPSNSFFDNSSFKECVKLKEIVFKENVNKVIFGPESFACSGLESLKIEKDFEVEIKENAFIFCRDLKQVILTGEKILCKENSFYYCSNLNEFSYVKRTENSEIKKDFYFKDIINRAKYSTVKKFSFNLVTVYLFTIEKQKLFLENDCFAIDDRLIDTALIDNVTPFKKLSKSKIQKLLKAPTDIKKNEIINVPSVVEKINLESFVPHIKQINWPDDCIVKDLGPSGFFSYYSLVEITIPKLVQQIPAHLFEHCHFMKILQFEEGSNLKEIGEFAFSDTSIEKVDLPSSVQIIKKSAFSFNVKLKEVKFNGEIIESEAFLQTGLIEFKLSNNTKIIESSAFQFCRCLKKFDIDIENSKLTEIGPCAFYETSITKINIPPGIKTIQKSVFNGCKFLKEVKISSKSELESIEEYSFSGNLSLEKINIPTSISKLSYKAFINTPSLNQIMNESNGNFIVNKNNDVYLKDQSLIFVPRNLTHFEVNKNCSVIHSGSFCGPNLETVSFQDETLIRIGESAFAHSTSLKKITFPKSIKKIGSDAFIDCQNLETVIFDSNCPLKRIPKSCFAFSGLKNVILPRFVEIIDHFSFFSCKNLKNIDLYETNVRFIGDSAFCDTSIEKVQFPPTIQFIENNSFEATKSLKIADFSSCSNVENCFYRGINKVPDFILENKKKRKKPIKIENSNSFQETPKKDNRATLINITTPRNNSPLIVRPSIGNVTPRNSYSRQSNTPIVPVVPTRKSFSKVSPRIKKSNTIDEPKQLRAKLNNVTCYVQESAFCNSSVSIFKFDLNEYRWFNFFNKCIQVKEYIINSNINLYLKKLAKERIHYYSLKDFYEYQISTKLKTLPHLIMRATVNECPFDHLLGSFYKVSQLKWEGQDVIPWKLYGPRKKKSIPKRLSPFNFMNTSNLIRITFTDDIEVKTIPKCCFSFTLLEEITIPKSVVTICRSAFQYSYGLRKVTFSPEIKLKEIENYAFFDCKNLNKISLPDSISVIPDFCFASSGLEEIKLPNSIVTIYAGAFHHCDNLKSVVLNEGLKEIGSISFSFCNSLVNIDLPNSLTTIRPGAFSNCSNLHNVNLTAQSNLAFIYEGAFDFTSIEVMKLNSTIQEICNIRNMPKLQKITFHDGKLLHYEQDKDWIVYKLVPTSPRLQSNMIKSIKLDDGDDEEEGINEGGPLYQLIKNQQQFKKIFFIPKNISCLKYSDELNICGDFSIKWTDKNYSKDYYVNSSQITQMKFLKNNVIIQDECFSYFNSIHTIEFSEDVNLLQLDAGVFNNCQNLHKIIIPNSCIRIYNEAFKDCKNLKTVLFGNVDKSYEKKSSLKDVGKRAFYNCSSLLNIILPPTVSRIGDSAFMNCTKLKRFEIGTLYLNNENKSHVHFDKENEKLEFIGKFAFKNCTSLVSFRIPHCCKELENSAFMNCTSLSKISDSNSQLKRINSRTFYNCSSLTSFHLYCNIDPFNEGFTIGYDSFMNCTSLKEFAIENDSNNADTLKEDNKYCDSVIKNNAFYNCKSLVTVKFLTGKLRKINIRAFMNCSSLKKIVTNSPFYKSIVNNDNSSFFGCPQDLTLVLFNENKKVRSLNISVEKSLKFTPVRLFKNHLSSLNKDLLSSIAKDDEIKKRKTHSTLLDSFDGPKCSIKNRYKEKELYPTPSPAQYRVSYQDYRRHITMHGLTNRFNNSSRNITEYNYTIITPRPPLNI